MKDFFWKAHDAENKGKYRKAFRFYLKGALAGDASCELNLGYCYDYGIGVKRNKRRALYHYHRCMDRGDASGANNIGINYLQKGDTEKAKKYLLKAIEMGEHDAALMLAEAFLKEGDLSSAKKFYQMILSADKERVCESSIETAQERLRLLNEMSFPKLN